MESPTQISELTASGDEAKIKSRVDDRPEPGQTRVAKSLGVTRVISGSCSRADAMDLPQLFGLELDSRGTVDRDHIN